MICPQCGYDMGTAHRCLRCGYEVKTLVAVDEEEQRKREEDEIKVIDPENTYLTDEYGYAVDEDEDVKYSDPFDMLFGSLFGDPFSDLLGGLFGFDVSSRTEPRTAARQQEKSKKDDVVEVKKVEFLDENGNPIKQDGKFKQTVNKVKEKVKNATHRNSDK